MSGCKITQLKCLTAGMQTGAASGGTLTGCMPGADLQCWCVPKASARNVQKPVRTQCTVIVHHSSHACINPYISFVACVCVCVCPKYYSSKSFRERSLLWHLSHVARCVVRPTSVSEETDCCISPSHNPTFAFTLKVQCDSVFLNSPELFLSDLLL